MTDFVADENLDFALVKSLREFGFEVYSISENFPSYADIKVLDIAIEKKAILLTEDKDFGYISNRINSNHFGIVLLRLSDIPRKQRIEYATEIIKQYHKEFVKCFSVISSDKVRIRKPG